MDLKLRCSASGCECTNFTAASSKCQLRTCDACNHSWITHLLEKLLTSRDDALSIFDVCSLALYGTQALPIRLKIVIERLLSTLSPDHIDKILRSFGWSPNDLARGYMIQDSRGVPLSRWLMLPREEEILILQQFLRFPMTRSLSFILLRDDFPNNHIINQSALDESTNHTPQASIVKSPKPSSTATTPVEITQNKAISSSSDSSSHEDVDPVDLSSKNSSITMEKITMNKKPSIVAQGNGSSNSTLKRQQQWTAIQPPATATQLVNPTTGKRRVQCSVCLKTFCDKGALKIHFSAVHLREMHKCTVVGCNMMFSSRRSRNRHSANPNPKLHSPHLRRKISPHDGRTCQAQPIHPIIFNPVAFNNTQQTTPMKESNNSNSSCYEDDDDDDHEEEEEYNNKIVDNKKDGARKRKLKNPVRLPSVTTDDYSGDDFCCYDDGTEINMSKTGSEDELMQDHLGRISKLPIFNEENDQDSKRVTKRENKTEEPKDFDEEDEEEYYDDGENGMRSNGSSPNSNGDNIPIDRENPRRCIACGKVFQNHFGVKTHYQNVHLKLMHKCTVDGCNAAFPSKRSRDRHSANLNLHRKLLSTSDISQSPSPDIKSSSGQPQPPPTIFNPFFFNNSSGSANAPGVLLPTADLSNQPSPDFSKQSLLFNPYFFNWSSASSAVQSAATASAVVTTNNLQLPP
ncbi:unnamed protein product, partial [Allacma fusca]